ncbi:ABC transporter permease [Candidatus Stoquefichus sp. SB1]|uniref:ABC transporter permease n=1 Tax=Candidatus Stoquefichus sp. SB1 TaxID=1658109 RepID=UPI00067E990B|nr:ABC transporter permease [Candidatus Stoquefichus sp. SB1]
MKIWILLKHEFFRLIASPSTLSIFLIFPFVLISLMGFLFEDLYHTSLLSSYDFYGVTMLFYIAMMSSTVPANVFLEKKIKSGNTRIFYSPVSREAIYGSKIIVCFFVMSVCFSLNIIVFEMTSFVNFGGENIGYVILLMIIFILFLVLLSSAICVSIRSEEITNIILSNSMSVLGLLSGIFFPIASLGVFFERIAEFSPIKWTIDCLFQLIYDGGSAYYWWIMAGLLILSLLLLGIVHKNYQPENYI